MTNTIYYGITEAINFLINFTNDKIKIVHFILTELVEIFCLLGLMIYLEIILNFCGLNDNVKSRIMEKGEEEFSRLSFTGDMNIFIDDDDEGNEYNEEDNYNNNDGEKTNNKDNKEEVEKKLDIKKQYRNI